MNDLAHATQDDAEAAPALEREVDEAIAICEGDVRAALRAALIANTFLGAELERLGQAVSLGFMRGRLPPARRASEKMNDWREISSATDLVKLP